MERVLLESRLSDGLAVDVLDDAGLAAVLGLAADGLIDGEALARGRVVLTVRGRLLADGVVRRLLPGVSLKFNDIAYQNFSVVVLNLRAPSVLLGFEVGGIVGHKFLSPYRVSLDLDRSEMRISKAN